MKRFTFMLLLILATSISFAQKGQLPSTANDFINIYFPEREIVETVENTSPHSTYLVEIAPDVTIIFDISGEWQSIETASSTLPTTLLKENTKRFILTKYNSLSMIMRIDKIGSKKEITFFDGNRFLFDESGQFEQIIKN